MKYAASAGASFRGLWLLISLKLSKLLWNYCDYWLKNEVFELPLAEISRYQKSETAKRCTVQSCIFYIPNTELSNQYLWPQSNGSLKKSSIFDGVRPLPRRPIKPAGSKTGTVANTKSSSIMASKCISKLAQLHPPSASPNSPYYGLQVHLWVHSISASKCISKLAWSWPASASPTSLYLGLHVTVSSHNNGLQVYLWVHSIVIMRRTSNCSQPPPAASPDILYVDRYIDV